VNEKTADLLATALEQLFEVNKISATDVLGSILGAPVSATYRKYARIGYKAGLKHALKKMPEPSKKQVTESLAMIEAFKSTPAKMRSFLKNAIKELPHATGGPKRKLTRDEEAMACAEVAAHRAELGNREAIERVARKRKVSARTIYRILRDNRPKEKKS
jgi:hypothetical protein